MILIQCIACGAPLVLGSGAPLVCLCPPHKPDSDQREHTPRDADRLSEIPIAAPSAQDGDQ